MMNEHPFPPSIWADVTPTREVALPLQSRIEVDTAIIGAGVTGLSAALHLAKQGRKVAVLEAMEVGWGASGRNNGQIIPTMTAIEPDMMVARFGEVGRRFVQLVGESADRLFSLIRQEAIAAEAEQTGWFQPAHSPGRTRLSQRRVEMWQHFGFPARYLDRQQTADLLGTDFWYGGMFNPTGGHVNPLALVRGMADRACHYGAQLYEHTAAMDYYQDRDGWFIRTQKGQVRATNLIIASNAYTAETPAPIIAKLAKTLSQTIVPFRSWQMSTPPIEAALRTKILPGRQAVSDTRGDLRFFRYDARHRLITGGLVMRTRDAQRRVAKKVIRLLAEAYPDLANMTMTHIWSGYIGMSRDHFPHIHRFGENGWCWIGCNGRGVALGAALGQELARAIDEGGAQGLALPITEPQIFPLQGFAKRIAPYYLGWLQRQDKREMKIPPR